MTKKDFEMIASILKEYNCNATIYFFTEELSAYYDNFNRDKFMIACGVEQEGYKGSQREADDEIFDLANNS